MTLTAGAIAAVAVTLAACPVVLHFIRQRLLDQPNQRSSHEQPTPRGGGLAIVVGAAAATLITPSLATWRLPLILTASGFGLLGFMDDLRARPALKRLLAQGVLAVAAIPLLLRDLTGDLPWRIVFTVGVLVWLIYYVNAFNFMDGINGISVAQVIVAGTAWWALGRAEDVPAFAAGGLIIAACAAAFAPFNFPQARMFLGDVGSYFLGGWLAVLVVVGVRSELPVEAVIAPLAVALIDTLSTITRRLRRGDTLHEAHCEHVYQRLVKAGWSHSATTAFVTLTLVACSLAGAMTVALPTLPARIGADIVITLILLGYLCSPSIASSSRGRRTVPAQ